MKRNKFNAKKTVYNGVKYDSKFEAEVAQFLDTILYAGKIDHWEGQYSIELIPFDSLGNPVLDLYDSTGKPFQRAHKKHRVDFLIHHHDNSFTLLEAKGVETAGYKSTLKWIKRLFLPQNPEYRYLVVKNKTGWQSSILC